MHQNSVSTYDKYVSMYWKLECEVFVEGLFVNSVCK